MTHGGYGITLGILLTLSLTANNAVQNIEAVMQQWGQLASTRELRNLPAQPQPFADTTTAVLPADQAAYALRQASLDYGPDHSILANHTHHSSPGKSIDHRSLRYWKNIGAEPPRWLASTNQRPSVIGRSARCPNNSGLCRPRAVALCRDRAR